MSKTATESRPCVQAMGTSVSYHAPAAGTFNNWDSAAIQIKRDAAGTWTANVYLSPSWYEYKFVVDGEWCCERECETAYHGCPKCVPNSSGTMKRFVEVT